MADAYICRRGGGNAGGTLTVTVPSSGITVTVSKDGVSKTKTSGSDNKAAFGGLTSGTWLVTITQGSNTASQSVNITTDYSVVVAFFAATIKVTYPSGSTLTCTNGSTTLTATTTTGSYTFTVPNAGTWTVKATSGSKSDSESVTISSNGESKSVTLAYELYLFNAGDTCSSVTGGWATIGDSATIGSASLDIAVWYDNKGAQVYTKNRVDVTNYSTLYIRTGALYDDATAGLMSAAPNTDPGTFNTNKGKCAATVTLNTASSTHSLNISSLTGLYYIWAGDAGNNVEANAGGYINSIWLT